MIQVICFIFATLLKFAMMAKFGALDPQPDGLFSDVTAVSPNGKWIAFSEPTYGNVHLFKHKKNGWAYSAVKTDGTGSVDLYGYALALSNDALAIGVPYRGLYGDVDRYNFDKSSGTWILDSDTISCSSCSGYIGRGLSIDENTMAVGSSSVVMVLTRTEVGGSWSNVQELTDSESSYGADVSVSGNYLAISRDFSSDNIVYIYERTSELDSFIYLTSTTSVVGVGHGISLSGEYLAYSVGIDIFLVNFLSTELIFQTAFITEPTSRSALSLSVPSSGSTGILAIGDVGSYVTTYKISLSSQTVTLLQYIEESFCGGTMGHSVSIPSVDEVGYDDMFLVSGSPTCYTDYYNGNSGVGFACSVFKDMCSSSLANGLMKYDYTNDHNYGDDAIAKAKRAETELAIIFGSVFGGLMVVLVGINIWGNWYKRRQNGSSLANGNAGIIRQNFYQDRHVAAASEAKMIEAQLAQQHQQQANGVSMIPIPGSFQAQYQKVTPINPMASAPIEEMVSIPYAYPVDQPPSYKFG